MLNAFKTLTSGIMAKVNKLLITSKADWSQNDSNKLDFIKNKPFYTEIKECENVLLNQTLTYELNSYYGFYMWYGEDAKFTLTSGKTYNVVFDGVEYECVAKIASFATFSGIAIGNLALIGAGDNTGEPFIIGTGGTGEISVISNEIVAYTYSAAAITSSHHVKIYNFEKREIVHKLDEKYLPDSFGYLQEEVENNYTYLNSRINTTNNNIVQSDWNETSTTSKAYIKNKPVIPEQVQSDWNVTDKTSKAFILNKPEIVQSDWNISDETSKAHVLNRTHYDNVTEEKHFTNISTIYYKQTTNKLYMNNGAITVHVPNYTILGLNDIPYSFRYVNGEVENIVTTTVLNSNPGYQSEYYIGNRSLINSLVGSELPSYIKYSSISTMYEDTGEEFLFYQYPCNDTYRILLVFKKYSPNFELYKIEHDIKQLDEKFIPDTIARKEDIKNISSVADFYELENKPFECELNLIETIHVSNINGTVHGYINTNLNDYQYICVEIDDKNFFDIIRDRESSRWGDVDKSLWDNGDGYGFYIEFEDRGVGRFTIYTDTNRYGQSLDVKLYEQLTKKTINPVYLPEADSNSYGVVKVDRAGEYDDYEQYAPCVIFDGQVHSKSYKAANVFNELSFENLETLIDYIGNHGLFTESVVEGISNEIELTLPVHVWYIGNDYRDYSRKYLFETANGETLLLNIKNSTITKVERLAGASASSYGIVTLPSEEYPVVDNETFLSLPDGIYNYLEGIEIKLNMGEDDEGNPIINYSLIRGLFQKFDNHAFSYGNGCGFTNLYIDDENGELCATYAESLDGVGQKELESFANELLLILGFDKELTTEDKTIVGAVNELNDKVSNSFGAGGTSFKTFNLQLDENAKLEIVDMGNNLVAITFLLKTEEYNILAEEGLMYTLPTDNAEFTEWFKDKAFVIQANPIVSLYGKTGRQGTYCNFNYLGMLGGVETEVGGGFMLMATFDDDKGFTDEKLLSMTFTTVANSRIALQGIS